MFQARLIASCQSGVQRGALDWLCLALVGDMRLSLNDKLNAQNVRLQLFYKLLSAFNFNQGLYSQLNESAH